MGRSKEMGKPVAELRPDELEREFQRCRGFLKAFGNKVGAKGIRQRLREIEKRRAPSPAEHRDGSRV